MSAGILGPFNDVTTKFISENGIFKQRLERLVLYIYLYAIFALI